MPISMLALAAGLAAIAPARRLSRKQTIRRLKRAGSDRDAGRYGDGSPSHTDVAALSAWERRYHQLVKTRLDPLLGRARDRALRELAARPDRLVLSERERFTNLRLASSTLLMVVTIVTLPLPFLIRFLVCVPLAAYLVRGEFAIALRTLVQQRRLSVALLNAFYQSALWLGGFYVLGASLFVLTTLGGKLSSIAEDRSQKGLADAFGQHPQTVWVDIDGTELEVPFEQLKAGDTVVVHAGEMIPTDGRIIQGSASVDQHRLTGEGQPADKGVGDAVLAATVVLAGSLHIRADETGATTVAAKIGELLNNTASYQLAVTTKADRLADAWLLPTFVIAGVAGLAVGYRAMIAIASAILGISLRISGPIALLNYLNRAARGNILIKDGRSLELLTSIDTVVFDKSGTLTLDEQQVVDIHGFGDFDDSALLTLAAAIEQRQSHPIARAILACAEARGLPLPAITERRCELGFGIEARVGGERVQVGSERFMTQSGVTLSPPALACAAAAQAEGRALVMIAVDGRLAGAIELEATLRPEVPEVLAALQARGLKLYIISGDQEAPTRRLAETLGIDDYHANTLPADKAALIEQLQRQGRSVCFVGDGINDSIALKKANVSISLTGATRVATDTAQIVLIDGTLGRLPDVFALAEGMERNFRRGMQIATLPVFAIWGGVLFLHLGIFGAAVLFELSVWAGIANAARPIALPRPEGERLRGADDAPPRNPRIPPPQPVGAAKPTHRSEPPARTSGGDPGFGSAPTRRPPGKANNRLGDAPSSHNPSQGG